MREILSIGCDTVQTVKWDRNVQMVIHSHSVDHWPWILKGAVERFVHCVCFSPYYQGIKSVSEDTDLIFHKCSSVLILLRDSGGFHRLQAQPPKSLPCLRSRLSPVPSDQLAIDWKVPQSLPWVGLVCWSGSQNLEKHFTYEIGSLLLKDVTQEEPDGRIT